MTKGLRVAFYVRNAFQAQHLRPLFRVTPDAVWLVKSQSDARAFGIPANENVETAKVFVRRKMEQFDIVVSHASPRGKAPLQRAKFVMVQYGYAKEPYNFGEWRKMAQAILAYGDYAVERFSEHAPSFAIGNPGLDNWNSDGFEDMARASVGPLPTGKPVFLFAPTWGDLSSLPQWSKHVAALSEFGTVLLKAHHNSLRDGELDLLKRSDGVIDVSHVDLMQVLRVCDVMISDYSGAIFDGIMCEKPVVLLDVDGIEDNFGSKLDHNSLEMRRRDELGIRVQAADALAPAVTRAVTEGPLVADDLKKSLFVSTSGTVGEAFLKALTKVMDL